MSDRPWSVARPGEPKRRAAARSFVIYKLAELGPMTNRELANSMQMQETEVAPRVNELVNEFLAVRDTGRRKSSLSGRGRKQVVWEIATEPCLIDYAGE